MNLVAAATAFVVSALSMFFVLPVLVRGQVLDRPNHRSSHASVTPRGGGTAVLLGVLAGLAVGLGSDTIQLNIATAGLIIVVVLLAVIGFSDDVGRSSLIVRFWAQIALGVVMSVATLGGSHLAWPLLILVGMLGIIWLASYVNAFNFMDGVNAISGVSAVAAGLWYASVGSRHHDPFLTVAGLTLAGASLGFLPWNAPRARVFLGDVGSYGIGAMIAFLAWTVAIRFQSLPTALAPVAVYLADTSFTLARRFRRGEPLTQAHRDHVYQRLNRGGHSHLVVSSVVVLFTVAICACVRWLSAPVASTVSIALLLGYVALPAALRPERGSA